MKTTDKIKSALIGLLETTSPDEITATSLCKHANVNRATFYYHYNSVQDVLAEIETHMESEFAEWMSQSTVDASGAPEKSFYVTFFDFVARNAGVCRMLLNSPYPSEFFNRAMAAGRAKVVSVMNAVFPACPAEKIEFYYIFVSNGFLGLLKYWLNSGMKESVVELAEIGESVSSKGLGYLQ